MKRICSVMLLLAAGWLVTAESALALRIAPPPGPVRIVQSDVVFVGRVVAIEPVDVEATSYPGVKATTKYSIAVVNVSQVIRGLKTEKSVRVGFIAPTPAPKEGPIRISSGGRSPTLQVGQDGLFMINKHHEGKFYLAPNFGYFVSSQDKNNFDNEVNTARKIVAIMANPTKALRSKDADDRLLAASIAINTYRTNRTPGPVREAPISAEETRLILDAIASAKWEPFVFGKTNPWQLFNQLGVTANDGWNPQNIRSVEDQRAAVQAWIRANGDTYRIKRFVPQTERQ